MHTANELTENEAEAPARWSEPGTPTVQPNKKESPVGLKKQADGFLTPRCGAQAGRRITAAAAGILSDHQTSRGDSG